MAAPRTAAVRDAAQFLEFAAQRLLKADALSSASDRRAVKLLGHVQAFAEVARGLAEAMEKAAPTEKCCGTCLYYGSLMAGRCCVDPVATGEHDLPEKSPETKACRYWQESSDPRKAVGT